MNLCQSLRVAVSSAALFASLIAAEQAFAQAVQPAEQSDADENAATATDDGLGFGDIIVTAGSGRQRKFDTSFAITTVSQADIQRLSPRSTADLLGRAPGIFAEATGGEASNVYRVRGIPNEGSFYTFQEDGIPIYQESAGFFFTGDGLQRTDIMTQSYEIVRGGPAPVYASNAAAIFNLITRQGGDDFHGGVRTTLGDTGLYRLDAYASGPLGNRTYFAIGGFLRHHDGYRDNGFPSDEGGQVRLNLRKEFDTVEIRLSAKYFNDRNTFYLPIPLADPRNPGTSLNQYIDFFNGTLNTPALADGRATVRYADASGTPVVEQRSLNNGRRTEYYSLGGELDFHPTDTFRVRNIFRYTKGNVDLDALYSSTNPVAGTTFADGQLAGARAVFGAGVSRLGYAIAGTNGATVYDPASASGLIVGGQYRAISDDFQSVMNDFRVTGEVNFLGRHELTGGIYIASYQSDGQYRGQDYLFEVRSNPRPLDLIAYSATNTILGSVTDNGVLRYSSTLLSGRSSIQEWDFYAADTWHVSDRLSIEGGVRVTTYDGHGFFRLTRGVNLGNAATVADNNALSFTGAVLPQKLGVNYTSWTAGANWRAADWLSVYARASRSFRGPSEFNLILPIAATTTSAQQFEGGVKIDIPTFSLFVTGFYNKFDPFTATLFETNPTTGQQGFIAFVGSVTSPGVEVDLSWRPARFFTLEGSFTYNDAQLGDFVSATGAQAVSADGNQPIRQPNIYGNIRPSFNFSLGDAQVAAYGRYTFVGNRFVDLQNLTRLPAYQTLALGVSANWGRWTAQVDVDNVTNAHGVTEGNPRTDQIAGQGSVDVIYGRPIFGRNVQFSLTYAW